MCSDRWATDGQTTSELTAVQAETHHTAFTPAHTNNGNTPSEPSSVQTHTATATPAHTTSYTRTLPMITIPEVLDVEVGWALCAYAYSGRLLLPSFLTRAGVCLI